VNLGIMNRTQRGRYLRDLKSMVAYCLTTDTTRPFRIFVRRWIYRGAPIDPAAYYAPTPTLQIVLRQLCVALPGLSQFKADALLWLTLPECRYSRPGDALLRGCFRTQRNPPPRFRPYSECFIPWNLALYAPEGTPYATYNKIGLTVDIEETTNS